MFGGYYTVIYGLNDKLECMFFTTFAPLRYNVRIMLMILVLSLLQYTCITDLHIHQHIAQQ